MIHAHRWLAFAALAALWTAPASGASPQDEKPLSGRNDSMASEFSTLDVTDGIDLFAPSLTAGKEPRELRGRAMARISGHPPGTPRRPHVGAWPHHGGRSHDAELPISVEDPSLGPLPISIGYTLSPDPPPGTTCQTPTEPLPSVPEPGSLVLFGGGILAVLALRVARRE